MEHRAVHRFLIWITIGFPLISTPICYGQNSHIGLSTKTDFVVIANRACSTSTKLDHPRSLPQGAELLIWKEALFSGALAKDFSEFAGRVTRQDLRVPDIVDEPELPLGTPWSIAGPRSNEVYAAVGGVAAMAQQAMLLYSVNRNPAFRAIALRRLKNLALLDPKGITSVASNDLSAVPIISTLAMGLDLMDTEMDASPSLRTSIRSSIEQRMKDLELRFLRRDGSLRQNPRSSHGYPALGAMAAVALTTSGQVPSSSRLCSEVVELFLAVTSPWGGADGGSSQGMAYAIWDMGMTLPFFDTLKWAGGVDLSTLPWLQNFGRFMVYFQPPGSPRAIFGDAAELDFLEYRARFAKAYTRRMPANPLYDWYDANLFGNDPLRVETLTVAPRSVDARKFPAGTPNGAVFNSVGWAAMHSDLRFRDRISVYFKSSPYGSGGHGHADQNSFVINARGKQVLADGGYYDYFGSPHHLGWTKQTIAHNAVTYDGGKGQPLGGTYGSFAASGAISQFETTTAYDLVTGNAKAAYGADITAAVRSIAFLRPNIVVVFDRMSATGAHTWEWNFQSLGTMTVEGDTGRAKVANGGVEACLQFFSNVPSASSASSGFPVSPLRTKAEPRPDQWRGMFRTTAASKEFWAATVIDVGCEGTERPQVSIKAGNSVVRVAGKTIIFNGVSVILQQ